MKTHKARSPSAEGTPAAGDHIYATRLAVPGAVRDPVCHMTVTYDSPHRLKHNGTVFRFCTARCLEKFRQWPERYVGRERPNARGS